MILLEDNEERLLEILRSQKMDVEEKYQRIVEVASLASHAGEIDDVLVLLNVCPPEYFADKILEQMVQNPIFALSAMELVDNLKKYGIIENKNELRPTMKAAEA